MTTPSSPSYTTLPSNDFGFRISLRRKLVEVVPDRGHLARKRRRQDFHRGKRQHLSGRPRAGEHVALIDADGAVGNRAKACFAIVFESQPVQHRNLPACEFFTIRYLDSDTFYTPATVPSLCVLIGRHGNGRAGK